MVLGGEFDVFEGIDLNDSHPVCTQTKLRTILPIADPKLKRSTDVVVVATKSSSMHGKSFPDPLVTPVTTILKWRSEVIPLSKSIIHKLESRSVADTGMTNRYTRNNSRYITVPRGNGKQTRICVSLYA